MTDTDPKPAQEVIDRLVHDVFDVLDELENLERNMGKNLASGTRVKDIRESLLWVRGQLGLLGEQLPDDLMVHQTEPIDPRFH